MADTQDTDRLREFQEIFAGRGLEALPDPRNHVKV